MDPHLIEAHGTAVVKWKVSLGVCGGNMLGCMFGSLDAPKHTRTIIATTATTFYYLAKRMCVCVRDISKHKTINLSDS